MPSQLGEVVLFLSKRTTGENIDLFCHFLDRGKKYLLLRKGSIPSTEVTLYQVTSDFSLITFQAQRRLDRVFP